MNLASAGIAGAIAGTAPSSMAEDIGESWLSAKSIRHTSGTFEVLAYGAVGDGKSIDTPAINRAIEASAVIGGGTVHF